jgi:hypothetical protein
LSLCRRWSSEWSHLGAASGCTYAVRAFLLIWTFLLAIVYAVVASCLPGTGWRKGVSSGLLIWAVAFVWVAIFSHFNVLAQPFGLVVGELVLEAIICVIGGITLAVIYKPAR